MTVTYNSSFPSPFLITVVVIRWSSQTPPRSACFVSRKYSSMKFGCLHLASAFQNADDVLWETWRIHYCLFQGLIALTVQDVLTSLIPVSVSGFCYVFLCLGNYKVLKRLAFSARERTYKLQSSHFSGFSLLRKV